MKILLQFPEGLKKHALQYAKEYEDKGNQVYLSSSACYGACDLALDEAMTIGAEKIVHFGHAKFIRTELPIEVEYIEYDVDMDVAVLVNAAEKLKKFKTISLGTTVQYVHQFDEIEKVFKNAGITVLAGTGKFSSYRGQVLGCDASAVTSSQECSDAIVFIGDGMFHALAIKSDKPVFVIHPLSGEMKQINSDIEKLRKKRRGALLAALNSEVFGILVSTKPGQKNIQLAEKIKKDLEKSGKTSAILVSNEFQPMSLGNFMGFDCYINTACPRLCDDREMFGKPIINSAEFPELLEMLNQRTSKKDL